MGDLVNIIDAKQKDLHRTMVDLTLHVKSMDMRQQRHNEIVTHIPMKARDLEHRLNELENFISKL